MRTRPAALSLLTVLLSCAGPSLEAQQPAASSPAPDRVVSAVRLMQTVNELASKTYEGRQTSTRGGKLAQDWVAREMAAIGLPPLGADYRLPFRTSARSGEVIEGANVASFCKGAGRSERVIVVSAHYDHLGTRDGRMYPGADDNASGVAVLLELARTCRAAPFQHGIAFVAFDAEEQGLRGARHFVTHSPIKRDRLALNINLDMVSRSVKGELYIAGTRHSPRLRTILEPLATDAAVRLRFGHDLPHSGGDDWTGQSDHFAFHEAGIPFVYFGVEDHPDYHQPTDTPEKIDVKFFVAAALTIVDALSTLDAETL